MADQIRHPEPPETRKVAGQAQDLRAEAMSDLLAQFKRKVKSMLSRKERTRQRPH